MCRSLATLLLLVVVGLAGCADSGGGHHRNNDGNPPEGPTGFIGFHVDWPEQPALTRAAIDPATQWFRIRVKEAGGAKYFADLVYPSTSVELEVPVGSYTVAVLAFTAFQDQFNGYLKLLSNGSTANPVVVVQHQVTQANVTLSASTVVFTEPLEPVYYGDLAFVEVRITNYPLEVKQGAMWFDSNTTLDFGCSLAATPATSEPMVRGCTATNPFPSSGSSIVFSAYLDGSAYAVDWDGAGPGRPSLWPSNSDIVDDTITSRSGTLSFSAPPPTGINISIQ